MQQVLVMAHVDLVSSMHAVECKANVPCTTVINSMTSQPQEQSLDSMTLQLQEAACGCEAWFPDPVC